MKHYTMGVIVNVAAHGSVLGDALDFGNYFSTGSSKRMNRHPVMLRRSLRRTCQHHDPYEGKEAHNGLKVWWQRF
jgi:hypothetical protein